MPFRSARFSVHFAASILYQGVKLKILHKLTSYFDNMSCAGNLLDGYMN